MFNEKGFSTLLIFILIFLIVLVVAGWYFYQQKNSSQVSTQSSSTNSGSSPSPSNSLSDETTNWETFTNTKFGYSFKHPSNIAVSSCKNNSCGESLYYPKSPGNIEISEDNELADVVLIHSSCPMGFHKLSKTEKLTNFKRASLQAQCSLPGVGNVNDPILPTMDEKFDNNSFFQYSFKLQNNDAPGPYYAAFFSQPINDLDINKDTITYYGIYFAPNPFKPLNSQQMELFNKILPTFKFTTSQKPS